ERGRGSCQEVSGRNAANRRTDQQSHETIFPSQGKRVRSCSALLCLHRRQGKFSGLFSGDRGKKTERQAGDNEDLLRGRERCQRSADSLQSRILTIFSLKPTSIGVSRSRQTPPASIRTKMSPLR